MDKLIAYNKICSIKPKGMEPLPPHKTPSERKIIFNLNELELYYNKLGVYTRGKKGGGTGITVLQY